MAQNLMTPGVYIEEKNAFPGSVVEVATAIPAFIGYTERASKNGKSLVNKPTRITSFADYMELFGGAFSPRFTLTDPQEGDKNLVTLGGSEKAINYKDNHLVYLFNSIRLFFSNGGGTCYIVSVGTYGGKDGIEIKQDDLLGTGKDENGKPAEGGLLKLVKELEPTMVVIPDAVALGADSYDVYKQMLAHCAKMQNRIAILDVFDGYNSREDGEEDNVNVFREKIGTEYLSYAAAYYPWLQTNVVQKGEITFKNFDESVSLGDILPEERAKSLVSAFPTSADGFKEKLKADRPDVAEGDLDALLPAYIKNKESNHHLGLLATSPTYSALLDEIRAIMNLLPAAPAMAGIYTMVDNSRGVWKSPANVGLNSVIQPAVNITHDQQEDLNVNALSGKSINAIRTFPGVGTLVWGGRTLDGNSLDWRYINVRRTMIMLEQSIKLALRAYVFEPNDANTWVTVKSLVSNFLVEKWKQGALAGASPEDAFDVQIGLGSTMTALDILEGKMLITVKLAIVRPAEFIVVTFEQQMQKS
ncbi:phage tail sheath family protein [Algoriphagus sp. NG3]|uniref:phage tail sheath family protein n=1 Tax=Algoriphagus sp. NG3 TaxID=3097546 RepID=UPI002A7FCAC8|nr:phage tail sheath C-terminal domain-containing protein [Algoriphagus sp. NG3]WPR77345.1 phage tail sheath C-terminal domain-containing protein [Algoriphagus sp. NG3]